MEGATGAATASPSPQVPHCVKCLSGWAAPEAAAAVRRAGVRAQPQMLIRVSVDADSEVVTFSSTEVSLGALILSC